MNSLKYIRTSGSGLDGWMKIAEGRKADIAGERNCLLQSKGAVKIGVFLPIIYLEMGEKQVLSKSLPL